MLQNIHGVEDKERKLQGQYVDEHRAMSDEKQNSAVYFDTAALSWNRNDAGGDSNARNNKNKNKNKQTESNSDSDSDSKDDNNSNSNNNSNNNSNSNGNGNNTNADNTKHKGIFGGAVSSTPTTQRFPMRTPKQREFLEAALRQGQLDVGEEIRIERKRLKIESRIVRRKQRKLERECLQQLLWLSVGNEEDEQNRQ